MTTPDHPDDFTVGEPLILLYIGNEIGGDLSQVYPIDVYAATHGWWRIYPLGEVAEMYQLVLARNSDQVLGAFRPKRWIPSPTGDDRWGFVGEQAELGTQLRYVGKRVPDKYRTSRNPVRYCTPED